MDAIEWHGNPLSDAGTYAERGGLRVELMRIDPLAFGLSAQMAGSEYARKIRRTWVVTITETNPHRICEDCLTSVLILDAMPEAAKREAMVIFRWALAAHGIDVELTD